jgi:Fanconi anemia group M protein
MTKEIFDIFSKRKDIIKEESKIKIIIDNRERNSLVFSELKKLGFQIEFQQLPVGDYIVKDIVIERKTVSDFISSMISHHLVKQLEELQQYENRLLIVEGISEEELYEDGEGVNSNAIRGFLLSIVLKWKMPLIFSKDSKDTAKFISVLAKKKESSEMPLNVSKRILNKKQQMQFVLEAFSGIGPKNAKKLLEKHKTLKNIFNLSIEQIEEDIGKKSEVFKILDEEYKI